jgi:quercetin dioxygenase-like cupin family protein
LDALKGNHGNEIPEEVVKSFWNSVRSIYSETWHYRSDLSRFTVSRSSADGAQPSPVPMEEESHHHILLKNELIEVIRATLPPGESTLFHIHSHDSAGVELTNDTTTEQLLGKPEGSPSTSKLGEVCADSLPDGRAYTHRIHNIGDGPMELINVEFLKKPEAPSEPAASTSVAENSEARVYKWVLAPGATSAMHTHERPYLIVAVTSMRLKTSLEAEPSSAEDMKPGDFRWVNSRMTHALTNGGAAVGQIVEIELK